MSLAGMPLNADFQVISHAVAAGQPRDAQSPQRQRNRRAARRPEVRARLQWLDLSGNASLQGSVAYVEALAAAYSVLRTLNLFGDSVVVDRGLPPLVSLHLPC